MIEPIFVQSAKHLWTGVEALSRLEKTNDTRFESEGGVLQVDDERWKVAQEYEHYTWLVHNTMLETDRNEIHQQAFDNYHALPDDLGKVIELGCGVFTNLRLILPGREADKVYLLDPLIKEYQNEHPHCTYADGTLNGHIVNMVDKAIEDWNTRTKFDTIVMINVIPHCKDALAVLDFIRKHLKKGGLLVMGEFPREIPANLHYDAGHPLSLHANILEAFIAEFKEVYRNGWYFIGQAK